MTVTENPRVTAKPAGKTRAALIGAGRVGAGLLLPLGAYYCLRAADVSIYLSLLASALLSAVPTLVGFIRHRRINGLSAYFTVMVVGGVAVSLVAGSTELLMAKEALLTGVTGVWFLASVRPTSSISRPLAYSFSKPLLENRLRWPADFDGLWATSSRWRRMWRVSSILFGIGTLADAVLRVVFAYTLPADVVPALSTGLYAATSVLLIVTTNVYYLLCGVHDRRSALYERDLAE
ncbi:MAG: VC0807 family protein [Nakamurella sp.]